ncbi:unnamed protein product, partial [marine sediment metagenome]
GFDKLGKGGLSARLDIIIRRYTAKGTVMIPPHAAMGGIDTMRGSKYPIAVVIFSLIRSTIESGSTDSIS